MCQGLGLGNQKEISSSPCIQRAHVLQGADICEDKVSVIPGKRKSFMKTWVSCGGVFKGGAGVTPVSKDLTWRSGHRVGVMSPVVPSSSGDLVLSQLSARKMCDYSWVYMRVCVCVHIRVCVHAGTAALPWSSARSHQGCRTGLERRIEGFRKEGAHTHPSHSSLLSSSGSTSKHFRQASKTDKFSLSQETGA